MTTAVYDACDNREHMLTEHDHFRLALTAVKPGGLVVSLFGGELCFIFRSVDGDDGVFELVGEAYVHGLLEGEAVAAWHRGRAC